MRAAAEPGPSTPDAPKPPSEIALARETVSTASFLKALAFGSAGGAVFAWLGAPLPWLLGTLFTCAALNLAGARLAAPVAARNTGQWVIGTAIGLYFTPDSLERLAAMGPFLVAATLWTVLVGFAQAWSLVRFARADLPTAFFSGAIGGASEMANQGERAGGSVQLIAAAHALRILLVAAVLPFAFQWLGVSGSESWARATTRVDLTGLAALIAATSAAALLARRLGAPNAWVIGPMLCCGALTGAGVAWSSLPSWLVDAGQVLIGISLGSRFRPGFFAEAPRFIAVIVASTFAAIGLSAGFGWALASVSSVSAATLILATSPGAVAEMSLTAKALGLGVPVVALFHMVRYVFLVLAIGMLYRLVRKALGSKDR